MGKWLLRQWLAQTLPGGAAVRAASRASPCRWAPGSPAWATRLGPLVAAAAGRGRDRRAGPGGGAVPRRRRQARGRRAPGTCCSTRSGTAPIFWDCRRRGRVRDLGGDLSGEEQRMARALRPDHPRRHLRAARGAWSRPASACGTAASPRSASGTTPSGGDVSTPAGLHVLPGLIDPHVHLRDPGDAAVESHPHRHQGGRAGRARPRCSTCRTPARRSSMPRRLAWKQDYVERVAWCDMGLYVGGTKTNIPDSPAWNRPRRVRASRSSPAAPPAT